MDLYDPLGALPVTIENCTLHRRERETSSGFTRVTTTVELHGDGVVGRGEDVTYDTAAHDALIEAGPPELAGEYTHAEFSSTLDGLDLFPEPPEQSAARQYRRWAYESAALDLALKRQGKSLADALGREYDPVRFVVSTRLGDPPSIGRIERWLELYPDVEFKLDPTSEWTTDLVDALAERDVVRVLDLKGQYKGTEVDQPADPELYERVATGFPDALIEDPELTAETRAVLDGHWGRVTWDYPITGVESIRGLDHPPKWLNIKPSRFGSVDSLLSTIEHCLDRGIQLYGGGQFELGVGRQHIHAIASLFYPDAPNDVAPRAYNDPEPSAGNPTSPLAPPAEPSGLEWSEE